MFLDWYQDDNPNKPDLASLDIKNIEALLVSPHGEVALLDSSAYPMKIRAKYFAIGSGEEVALGAMAMGASAEEAVRAAIKHTVGCSGPIQKVKL